MIGVTTILGFWLCICEPPFHDWPISDIPKTLDILSSTIEMIKVVRVLPHISDHYRFKIWVLL